MKRLAVAFAILLLGLSAIPASATTATDAEHQILDMINGARQDQGLTVLRSNAKLWDLAAYRAAVMSTRNTLTHSVAGSIPSQLNARSVTWYGYGEDIGYSPQRSVSAAADELFSLWKASPSHWAVMTSGSYNYIGIGLSYRSSNHRWYASLILTESPDVTPPRASVESGTRDGNDVSWTWRGWDPDLQTHTSGVDDFDVQLRRDSGPWTPLLTGTVGTAKTREGFGAGHWYGVRVRASDNRGNIGPWSAELRVWVP
jgi:hypothetical protein